MESGLPGNTVYAVVQTQDGYLWIGTQDGLVRFDGVNFAIYNRESIPELKDNIIRALFEDREGCLWIGTYAGGLTRLKQGRFSLFSLAGNQGLANISAISQDRAGNLWIGSFTEGLTCYDGSRFVTYTAAQGFPDNRVRAIYRDETGDLWATTELSIVKIVKPGVFNDITPAELAGNLKTTSLYAAGTRELWLGTGDSGLFCLKAGRLAAFGKAQGIPHQTIICLYRDSRDNFWIGTDGAGLTRRQSGVFSTLAKGEGLTCGYIYSLCEDREGSLWVGTLDGGLHQLRDSPFTHYTSREGLSHDYINCLCLDRAGGLWLGTKQGLNYLPGAGSQPLAAIQSPGRELANMTIESLFEDAGGCLWIGTWDGVYRLKGGKLTHVTTVDGLSDNRVRCVWGDSRGNAWIGTENGLNRYEAATGRISIFTTRQNLSGNAIEFIFTDSRGTVWISTSDAGLNTFRDGVISRYDPGFTIGNRFVCSAFEDNTGTLWLGTNGAGLICLPGGKAQKAFLFTSQDGLMENYVYAVLGDDRGYLWLGGRNGISRIRKQDLADFAAGKSAALRPSTYNERDGMKSRWCTGPAYKTIDGRFFFPTSLGATVIDPRRIKMGERLQTPIIEEITVEGESLVIPQIAAAGRPLEIGPGVKGVEFTYTAVGFIKPQQIRFKLMLEGYDRDWVDRGTSRSIVYTGLLPGKYTFRVMACYPDGEWNEGAATLSFHVRPYFYQTRGFYLLVILFITLGGFFLYRLRIRQLRAREKELSTLVELRTSSLKKRTVELEIAHQELQQSRDVIEKKNLLLEEQSGKLKQMDQVKSRFFANISHEFRTPLTLVMGTLDQILSGPGEGELKRKANLMLRNSQRLLALINQLLDLSKLDSGKMMLQAQAQDIILFLRGIVDSFSVLIQQSELDLVFQADETAIPLYFDSEKLEKVMVNLLMNAVKFTPAGGKITVKAGEIPGDPASFPAGAVEIIVQDTGMGISPQHLPHIFDRFFQVNSERRQELPGTGIGLALAKELVGLHHGKIEVKSQPGVGSEFIIHLPLAKDHLNPEEIVERTGPDWQKTAAIRSQYLVETGEEEPPVPFPMQPGPGQQREIILVVEDSTDMRRFIRESLVDSYLVQEAEDGQIGLDKARDIIPDLIISDVMMPQIDGYELCRVLKTDLRTSHIPIILLSARAAEESVIEGLQTGADDYITKPFNTRILLARIKNLIDLRRQLQQDFHREMTCLPTRITLSPIDKDFVKELKQVIEKNLSDPEFNVEQLGKKLYISGATLYRKIQALCGESPTDFIRSYRLMRAAELLKQNAGSITEVAFGVGFSSRAYFTRCFKDKFHQLPSAFQDSASS